MRRNDGPTLYDKEMYTTVEGLKSLGHLWFMVFGLVFGSFFVLLMAGSAGSDFQITNSMIQFYLLLSSGAATLFLVFVWALEHPNPWVTRAAYAILFLIPTVMWVSKQGYI